MKKFLILGLGVVILGMGGFFFLKSRSGTSSGQAVLKVTSEPTATFFLDNEQLGKTPYEDKVKPGEYTLKLVSESTVETAVPWEEKIKLEPNLLTYVSRSLGDSDVTSAGETLTLEKITGKGAELSVVSVPDGATITLKGEDKGVTPKTITDLTPGSYELTVSDTGFAPRTVKVRLTAGYKLNAAFQLALTGKVTASPAPSASPEVGDKGTPKPSGKASPKASPKATPKTGEASASATPKTKSSPPPKPYIEVQDTPTGFLNVRKDPSTSADILAKVNPGEFYPLLDEASDGKWFKIEYETNKEGWVAAQYAKKFE